MTDRITSKVLDDITRLMNDHRAKYNIPTDIKLFVIDTLAVPEQNLLLAIEQLLIGRRIKTQKAYDSIIGVINDITDPEHVKIFMFSWTVEKEQ